METSIIISGFGGQGSLFAGQALAYACMDAGMDVTWIPSYGPEMRGGTAHCTVILSDEPIGSPLVSQPDIAVVMNLPSMDKYEPLVQPGGVLVVNTSLVHRPAEREDIRVVEVPANEIADELGDRRLANMVMLGAMLAETNLLPLEAVERALEAHLPERHRELLEANYQALERGAALLRTPA
ncbi:MAG: 2-oxoacid:ferredoxin oxidoreductase subunit gamma [Chloroflexi bacterium]|nr:MAG: 2-oxoacid:ferredoxin oxidoreductase subunit gamma [Chloroflexota bacterium]